MTESGQGVNGASGGTREDWEGISQNLAPPLSRVPLVISLVRPQTERLEQAITYVMTYALAVK